MTALTLEERVAVDYARQLCALRAEMLFAEGRPNDGDEAAVTAGVLTRLLTRDLERAPS